MNSPDTFILFQLKPLEHPSCLNYSHEETPQEHLKQQKPPLQNQETQLTHFPKRKMCLCVFGESMRVNKEPQSVMCCYSRTGEHFKFEELFSCEERCHVSKAHRESERKRRAERLRRLRLEPHRSYFGDSREQRRSRSPSGGISTSFLLKCTLDYFQLNPQTVWYLPSSDARGI